MEELEAARQKKRQLQAALRAVVKRPAAVVKRTASVVKKKPASVVKKLAKKPAGA